MPSRYSAYMPQSPSYHPHTHQSSARSSTLDSDCSSTVVDYETDSQNPASRDLAQEKTEPRRKRKSVAFMAEDQLIVSSNGKPGIASSARRNNPLSPNRRNSVYVSDDDPFIDTKPVQRDTNTTHHVRSPPAHASPVVYGHPNTIPVSHPPVHGSIPQPQPSPTRKRRFSIVSPPPMTEQPDPFVGGQEPPSPRKRRISIVQPEGLDDKRVIPTHTPIKVPRSPPRVKGCRGIPVTHNGEPTMSGPAPSDDTHVHVSAPLGLFPKDTCQEITQRIREELCDPDFDFEKHIQNRKYVIRSHRFGGGPRRCVTMLDSKVDALLPVEPLLGLVGIDGLGPLATSDSQMVLKSEKPHFKPKFELGKVKGKGLGMFATAHIDVGERIIVEHPVVVTPYVIGVSTPIDDLYADIFGRLSEGPYQEAIALPTNVDASRRPNLGRSVYENIMKLNSLAVQLATPEDDHPELSTHRALFIQSARFNHSCGPNALYEWDPELFALIITAVRPIQPEEEICVGYVPCDFTSEFRASVIYRTYGFRCLCPFCSRPEEEIIRADLARTVLKTFWGPPSVSGSASHQSVASVTGDASDSDGDDQVFIRRPPTFEQWASDLSIPADVLPNAHLHALKLIAREGLEGCHFGHKAHPARDVGRHLDGLSMCYGALEDVEKFREWTRRADEAREKGSRYEMRADRGAFSKWLSNPASFPVWGRRKRAEEGRDGEGGGVADRRRFSSLEGF